MSTPTTLPIDEVTGRPVWHGLPVPWLVSWSGERWLRPLSVSSVSIGAVMQGGGSAEQHATHIITLIDPSTHPLGLAAGLKAGRDEYGLLWYESKPGMQDVGEPLFAQVNARRQRACMLEGRCQVCGKPFGDQPVTWLDSPTVLDRSTGRHHQALPAGASMSTLTAPTCRTCAAVAMKLCPAQKGERRAFITAHAYEPLHVVADVYALNEHNILVQSGSNTYLTLDSPLRPMALAKQMSVRITDYTEEEFTV